MTGLEQINDTHMHATLQRTVERLETREQFAQRGRYPDRAPKLTKQQSLELVGEAWVSVDHSGISEAGYRQTGPTLPDDDSVEGLYAPLQPFWNAAGGDELVPCAMNDAKRGGQAAAFGEEEQESE